MTTKDTSKEEAATSEISNTVNWKQAFATSLTLAGVLLAGLGAYLTVKSIDREYETSSARERTKIENVMALKRDNAEDYNKEVKTLKEALLAIESKIEKIEPEKTKNKQTSGIILSGENLKLSQEIASGLEDLNKKTFQLPEGLAASVNSARTELYNRYQTKIYNSTTANGKFNPNPYYIRQFDSSVETQIKGIIEKTQ